MGELQKTTAQVGESLDLCISPINLLGKIFKKKVIVERYKRFKYIIIHSKCYIWVKQKVHITLIQVSLAFMCRIFLSCPPLDCFHPFSTISPEVSKFILPISSLFLITPLDSCFPFSPNTHLLLCRSCLWADYQSQSFLYRCKHNIDFNRLNLPQQASGPLLIHEHRKIWHVQLNKTHKNG